MTNIKIVICRERERSSMPVPIPRHILVPVAICEEFKDSDVSSIPSEIMDLVRRNGYVIIEDPNYVLKVFGIKLGENEYVKVFIEE